MKEQCGKQSTGLFPFPKTLRSFLDRNTGRTGRLRSTERKVFMRKGLLFGTYDPLHAGHIRLFRECKKYCDYLIVCVHSDEYIKTYKGREPMFNEKERMDDVRQSRSVDEVRVNYSLGRKYWIDSLKTDVTFLSEEMKGQPSDATGEIIYMPRTEGISSTQMRGQK